MPEIIRTLIDRRETSEPSVLPEELRIAYGGDLWFPPSGPQRPYVIANFVSTVDGVVSYEIAGKSGEVISADSTNRTVSLWGSSGHRQTPSWWDPARFTRPPRSIYSSPITYVRKPATFMRTTDPGP